MDEIKLKKLEAVIAAIDIDTPSTQEVADLIAQIIQAVQEVKTYLEKQAQENKLDLNRVVNRSFEEAIQRLDEFNEELKKKAELVLENVQKNAKIDIDTITKGLYKELKVLKDLIPPPADFTNVLNKISEIEKRIPTLPDEITGERVIEKINESEGKIMRERVEGLEEELKALRDLPRGKVGMRKVPIIKRVNLTSQIDGATKDFTLPRDTVEVLGVWGTQFPINFDPGVDWTFAGNTLTLASHITAPESGMSLYAICETLFYG